MTGILCALNSNANLFKNNTTSLKYRSRGNESHRSGVARTSRNKLRIEAKIPRIMRGGIVQRISKFETIEIGE